MRTKIIAEDKHILVCFKPSGLAVQSSRIGEADMVSELKNYLAASSGTGKPSYLGLVHRLDQPVSGLIVCAKTPRAAAELSRQVGEGADGKTAKEGRVSGVQKNAGGRSSASAQTHGEGKGVKGSGNEESAGWENGGMEKEYTALVFTGGEAALPPMGSWQMLTDYLVRDGRTNTSRVAGQGEKDARLARLRWRVQEERWQEEAALVRVQLFTGRHHQIRVQLSHAGFPLLGDQRYGSEASLGCSARLGLGSVCLCASRLGFCHPATGKRVEYRTEEFPWKK